MGIDLIKAFDEAGIKPSSVTRWTPSKEVEKFLKDKADFQKKSEQCNMVFK